MLAPRHCRWSRQEIKWQSDAAGTNGTPARVWKPAIGCTGISKPFAVDKASAVVLNSPETA